MAMLPKGKVKFPLCPYCYDGAIEMESKNIFSCTKCKKIVRLANDTIKINNKELTSAELYDLRIQ